MSQAMNCVTSLTLVALLACLAGAATGDVPAPPADEGAGFEDDYSDDFEDDFLADFEALLDEDEDASDSRGFPDPAEDMNRKILRFNQAANKWAIDPISKGYAFIAPDPIRFAIRRFFDNLNEPVTFTNDLFQLEWKDAGRAMGSFVINSTVGLGGLLEPPQNVGFPRHRPDVGHNHALAKVQSGPYLMLPVMGPTNIRDGAGKIVDLFMRPANWFLGFGTLSILAGTGQAIVVMETHNQDFKELEKSSVDFYPVLRSAYYQNRMGEIWDRRQDRERR